MHDDDNNPLEALMRALRGGSQSPEELHARRVSVLTEAGHTPEDAERLMAISASHALMTEVPDDHDTTAEVHLTVSLGQVKGLLNAVGHSVTDGLNSVMGAKRFADAQGVPLDSILDTSDAERVARSMLATWQAVCEIKAQVEASTVPDSVPADWI